MSRFRSGDDFVFYFGWRTDVEKNEWVDEKDKRRPSARKLSRRLSLHPSILSDDFFEDRKLKIKSNREIELINKWRTVDKAHNDLQSVRESHQRKLESFEDRWRLLEDRQLQLKQNLVKFNNFVKEKLVKVEEGEVRSERQSEVLKLREKVSLGLEDQLRVLRLARDGLRRSVEEKEKYRMFLESVLAERAEMFDSVEVMMSRCESLIMSRDNLQDHRDTINSKIDQEALNVHQFKEEKMSELLDYNVKLSDLQNMFSSVFEETSDKKRRLENMEERKIEKSLLVLNIKLAISNMYRYVLSRKVPLPGDDPQEKEDIATAQVPDQLHQIQSHIEDLLEINDRVGRAERAFAYNIPMPTSTVNIGC